MLKQDTLKSGSKSSSRTSSQSSSRKFRPSRILSVAVIGLLSACGSRSATPTIDAPKGTEAELFSKDDANFRLSLTDAPNKDIKSVFVNVRHAEVFLARGGKEGRVIVAKNLGALDLLTLQNGVSLPISDLKIPEGVQVKQIRLVLEPEGNYLIDGQDQRCDLKTPSQQKTGIKLLIKDNVVMQNGFKYSVVVDFDAKKSIVLQGNGGCLLKPVLKVKSIARMDIEDDNGDGWDDDGSQTDDGVECMGGETCNDSDDGTGAGSGSGTAPTDGTGGASGEPTDGSGTGGSGSTGEETPGSEGDGTWDDSDESTLPDVYDNPAM